MNNNIQRKQMENRKIGPKKWKNIKTYLDQHYPHILPGKITQRYLTYNGFENREELNKYLSFIYKYDKGKKIKLNPILNEITNTPLKDRIQPIYEKQFTREETKERKKTVKNVTDSIFKNVIEKNTLYNVVFRYWIIDNKKGEMVCI